MLMLAIFLVTAASAAELWDTRWYGNELPEDGVYNWDTGKVSSPRSHLSIVPITGSNNAMRVVDPGTSYPSPAISSFYRQRIDPANDPGSTIEVRFNPVSASANKALRFARIASSRGAVEVIWYNNYIWVTIGLSLTGTTSPVQAAAANTYYKIRLTEDASGYNIYVNDVLRKTGTVGAYTTEPEDDKYEIGFGEVGHSGVEYYVDYAFIDLDGAYAPDDPNGPKDIDPYIVAQPTATIPPSPDEAIISWETSSATDTKVRFRQVGTTSWQEKYNEDPVLAHSVRLTGLMGGARYEYYVESSDGSSTVRSGVFEFTPSATVRILPGMAFGPKAEPIPSGGYKFSWACTIEADSYLYYRPVGSSTWTEVYDPTVVPAFDTGDVGDTTHVISVTTLVPGTTYEWYAKSTNPDWGEASTEIGKFDYVFKIESGPTANPLDGTCEIYWKTTFNATEKVYYRPLGTGSWTVVDDCTGGCGNEHWVNLTGLSTGQYEYYVESTSEAPGFGTVTSPIKNFETFTPLAGNLLQNGGFEDGVMEPWQRFHSSAEGSVYFAPGQGAPSGFHHNRPHHGLWRLEGGTQGKQSPGGIYQTVTVPGSGSQTLYAMAWVLTHELAVNSYSAYGYTWNEYDESHIFALFRVGIDPTGGTDWQSSNIVWSAPIHTYQKDQPYAPIGVSAQVNGGSTATIFVKCVDKPATTGYQMPVFIDDVWAGTNPGMAVPGNIVATEVDPMTVKFTWTTPTPCSSMVQHTYDGAANLSPGGWFAYSDQLTTNHSVTISNRFVPGMPQKYRVQSVGTGGWFVSDLRQFQTQPNDTLVNGDFEASGLAWDQDLGFGIAAIPWVKFGEMVGTSGTAGIVRDGQYALHGIHPTSPTHALVFEEGYSTNDNLGGVYQKIKIGAANIDKMYMVSAKVNTYSESSSPTDVANRIGIDPYGGTDENSGTVVWGPWISTERVWGDAVCAAIAKADTITVFLQTAHLWGVPLNQTMFDDVKMEIAVPVTTIEEAKNKSLGWPVELGATGPGILVTKVELLPEGTDYNEIPYAWVQEDDRSNAIKVRLDLLDNAYYIQRGDRVHLKATTNRRDLRDFNWGEAELIAQLVDIKSSGNEDPIPLFMTNKSLGGGNSGIQRGITGGTGANNIGLLVKTTGKVVSTTEGAYGPYSYFFYIDDGTMTLNPNAAESPIGIKVWHPYDDFYWVDPPALKKNVEVTGTSCLEVFDPSPLSTDPFIMNGSGDEILIPVVRMRDGNDLQILD